MTDSGSHSSGPISLEDLVVLNEEIASLVRAGVPLELGLSTVGPDLSARLRQLTERLAHRTRGGMSLADAIDEEGEDVPRIYRAVIRTGLRVGRLPEALESLTGFAKTVEELRRRINLALLYPCLVLLTAYVLFISFLVGFLPKLESTYYSFRLPDHAWMRFLHMLAETVFVWGPALPAICVFLAAWWFFGGRSALSVDARRSMSGTYFGWAGLLPGIINFHRANFAELTALLIEHGTPLPEAITLAGEAVAHPAITEDAEVIADRLRAGESLSASLEMTTSIPPFMEWMMSAGDRQSALAPALRQATDVYRRRAMYQADWFKMLLPVAAVLVIGGGATLIYGLTLFFPLSELYRNLSAL